MNIWIINQFASTPEVPGSERNYLFARTFAEKGHSVVLWTSSFSHWGKTETLKDDVPYAISCEGLLKMIRMKTSPLYYRNDHKRFLNMINFSHVLNKTSKSIYPAPDVIIASYPSPFAAYSAYKLAIKFNAKYVLEVRDLWPQVWIERKAFSKYHPFILILSAVEKYLYKRTRCFVQALPYITDYLSEKGIEPQSVTWIPNGIDLGEFNNVENDVLSESDHILINMIASEKQKGKMNVIYVGSLGVGNRVDCIIKAAKLLREKGEDNITFIIIGEGHSKKDLARYVADNKLDCVKIYPSILRKVVPHVLKAADVGVLCLNDNPIYRYGVNLHKVYDYMAAGLPIVFSANVRNNLVQLSKAGLTVPPANSEKIADALQILKSMTPEERHKMGKRGYRAIQDDFNINSLAEKYLSIIRED